MRPHWILAATVTLAAGALTVPGASAGTTPTVSIHQPRHGFVSYHDRAAVSGQVQTNGTPDPGVKVMLQSNPFPFHGYRTVASRTTDASGRYSFSAGPSLNTHYRVLGPSGSVSPTDRSIELDSFCCASSTAPGTIIHAQIDIRYPTRAPEAGQKAYWYVALNGARYAPLRATTTIPRPFKAGWSHLSAYLRSGARPGVRYNYRWYVLYRDQPRLGVGVSSCRSYAHIDYYSLGSSSCAVPRHVDTSRM